MDCSHDGIGVHTCGLNSNENVAVVCSVANSATIIPSTQAISTAYSFPVFFPTVQSTSISAQATSTFTNKIILECIDTTNLNSNLETLTVAQCFSSTIQLPIFLGAVIGAMVAGILICFCIMLIPMITIFRNREHWMGK